MRKKERRSSTGFTAEAKAKAIALLERGDVTQAQLGAELGVTARTLRNWRRALDEADEATPLTADDRRELKRLRRESQRQREEIEILKKFATFIKQRRSRSISSSTG
jgi:transposase-like protein